MANLGDLRSAVLDNLERAASDSTLQASNADRWINNVIRFVLCTRHNWAEMEATYSINTVQGQDLYAYPSPTTKDVKQVALRLDAGSLYTPLREDSEDQLDFNVTALPGIPSVWCRSGGALRLRPTPTSSNMRIRARVWDYPVPLTDPSATNYWTTNHADLIENFATALGYRWLGDFERYGAIWQVETAELGTRIENNAKRMRPSRMTVAPGQRAGKPTSSVGGAFAENYRQYNP